MDTNKMRELKALAEAQPVQVWTRTRGRRPDMRGQPLMYGVDGPEGVSDYDSWGFTRKAAEYIAAASPATILALLEEIERGERLFAATCSAIGAVGEALGIPGDEQEGGACELVEAIDLLKDENEALRSAALAAREFIMHEAEVRGLLDENDQVSHRHPRRQAAIAVIDAAMAKEASHG